MGRIVSVGLLAQKVPALLLRRIGCTVILIAVVSTARADPLRIYHIDVEQGDSTLLVSPSGSTLLVDSGKNGHGSRIKAVMDQAGVSRIDHFVATHYHEDHYGGIDDLVGLGITVGVSYDRGDKQFLPPSKLSEDTFIDYQSAVGQNARHIMRGETIPLDPDMSVTCISSGGTVLSETNPQAGADENDMSVSLLVLFGGFRYFVGGDIEQTTEGKIADRDLVLDVDVYQANHHGSHTSSSQPFMEDLKPSVVIISNGSTSRYQHPRQTTLDTYANLSPTPVILQTNKYLAGGDKAGNVVDTFIADPETSDTDGTILVAVDLAAGSYTVTYPNQTRTFAIKAGVGVAMTGASVVIDSLLPNPVGSDRDLEEVTLRNKGTNSVELAAWRLQDESGRVWPLVSLGTLAGGQSATISRNAMPMSLDNDGDEILLFDANNAERDRFRYTSSVEGIRIETGH